MKSLTIALLLCTQLLFAQNISNKLNWQKYGMDNTQLYLFRFADKVNNENLIVKVVNRKFKNLSDKVHINGKQITRKNEFIYFAKPTNMLYGIKLPFTLPANTWVLAFNYSDQFLMLEGENKIKISLKKADINNKWQLPEAFDMRSEIVLSFNQYLRGKADDIDANHIPRLSLSEKISPKTIISDTTLVFGLKKMPKGVALLLDGIDFKAHTNQEFIIENALLYKKELFFYVPKQADKKTISVATHPDQCTGKMTDFNGNIGYASGCITGMGSGKCMGILKPNASKKYKVTLIVEPN